MATCNKTASCLNRGKENLGIPAVLAARSSMAPGTPGVFLSAGLGNHDKVLAKGSCGLGEQRGTAVVPSGAGWGGTMEGGQESHVDTPRQLLQLSSHRDQTLLGHGHGYPSPKRGSHPAAAGHPHSQLGMNLGLALAL